MSSLTAHAVKTLWTWMVPAVRYASVTLHLFIFFLLHSPGTGSPLFGRRFSVSIKSISAFGYLMLNSCPFPLFTCNGSQWAVEIFIELKDVTQRCLSGKGKCFGVQAVDKTHVFMRNHALSYFLSSFFKCVHLLAETTVFTPHTCVWQGQTQIPFLIPFHAWGASKYW